MTESHEIFPDMMDTHQVARYLRVKERKIYELLKDRRIPCVKVTGKYLFPKADIDVWLAENKSDGSSTSARKGARPPMVLAGSHDPLLEWALRASQAPLAMAHGSSEDGLVKMASGQAAIAGMHLLDGETGRYNVAAVDSQLGHLDLALIHWAKRQQGLIVAPGNPLGLNSLNDVAQKSARVAMRQEGSGSRALFEYLALQAGLKTSQFVQSSLPAYTETEVGTAILDGVADVGIAVESVAKSLRLDFVPLAHEHFDLVVNRVMYFDPAVQTLLRFTQTPAFQEKARLLGGYDLSDIGQVVWNAN